MRFSFFESLPLKKYIISFLLSIAVTLFLFSACSILFSFFPPSKNLLVLFQTYGSIMTAFIFSILIALSKTRHGLISGFISANMCILLLYALGFLLFGSKISLSHLLNLCAVASIAGSIGGIIGINFK